MDALHPPERARSPIPGLLFTLPAIVFVAANVLKYELGLPSVYEFLQPVLEPGPVALQALRDVLVVVGPLAGLALSLLAVARARASRRGDTVVASVAVRLRPGHLLVAGLALAVLAGMGLYLFVENVLGAGA
jgi:hypothetical protein